MRDETKQLEEGFPFHGLAPCDVKLVLDVECTVDKR